MSPLFVSAFGPPADGYEAVAGRDPQTVKLKREYEAEVEHKVASDYEHIVWAYGIIWVLFCCYGAWLGWRAVRLQRDLDALERELARK